MSPIALYHIQTSPVLAAPQPIPLPLNPQLLPTLTAPHQVPLPHNPIPPLYVLPPHAPLPFAPFPHNHHLPNPPINTNNQISYLTSSLPSTKDVPLLNGKHDWGPWHSSIRTLILNANLLGHIADEPLPSATFDPGLWPTYPPTVHRVSSHADIQTFTDWWSRDGLASHILTSRLSPAVLGSYRSLTNVWANTALPELSTSPFVINTVLETIQLSCWLKHVYANSSVFHLQVASASWTSLVPGGSQ